MKISVYRLTMSLMIIASIACNAGTDQSVTEAPSAASPVDSVAVKNLAAVHEFNRAFETGNFDPLRRHMAPEVVDHAGMSGDVRGADSIIAMIKEWSAMATNMKSSVIREFADNEYVIQWMTVSGTMLVDAMGMKKGEAYSQSAVEVTKFNASSLITDHWTFLNWTDVMKMMATQPQK